MKCISSPSTLNLFLLGTEFFVREDSKVFKSNFLVLVLLSAKVKRSIAMFAQLNEGLVQFLHSSDHLSAKFRILLLLSLRTLPDVSKFFY